MTYRVTFVCTGNICRSPMAEHVFRRHVETEGLDVEVDSSGTEGWHLGAPADHRTVRMLERNGYTSAHQAKQFQHAWFDHYDLIIALDEGHYRDLRALALEKAHLAKVRLLRSYDPQAVDLNVPDPYYGDDTGFEECLELVEAAMPGLLDEVRKELP
ncbi:low molecular weight protein-tyrosine-phosphatase [Actinocorallia sp. B10E7]|uniref:low molecular weight protein-tyrosine-phosphatase n=1 Tax=Actinocorallia sp. B10E7 TaxID=3153558 RepID=UPI00325DAC83